MNKKEVTEIKKQFTPSNCAITRICGCYVDGEKEKKTEMKDAFLSLPEEEMFKYFDIFRKSLVRYDRKKSSEYGISSGDRIGRWYTGISSQIKKQPAY